MSIYRKDGIEGNIVTTRLPSGDMAVSSPASGPLEQLVFDICRNRGYRNTQYGGWIVKRENAVAATLALQNACITVSK